MEMFWTGAGLGFLVGVLVASMYLYNVFRTHKNTPRVPVPPKRGNGSGVMSLALVALLIATMAMTGSPAAAQAYDYPALDAPAISYIMPDGSYLLDAPDVREMIRRDPVLQATPVPLVIPTNQIFSETNNWLVTFAPIASIGIGISIALAVLGYLGSMIKSAFKA